MKKLFLYSMIAFFTGCASNFTYMPFPQFKAELNKEKAPINSSVELKPIVLQRVNNYSSEFENSVLRLRLDEEIKLLQENLEKNIKNILEAKGYRVVASGAEFEFASDLNVIIEESEIKKDKELLKGGFIQSNLSLSFSADMLLKNKRQIKSTKIASQTATQDPIALKYAYQSDQGVAMFKPAVSAVPTQINKGLENQVYEMDKAFLAFYKSTLLTLYYNLQSEASSQNKPENKPSNAPSANEGEISAPNMAVDEDGVIIFE